MSVEGFNHDNIFIRIMNRLGDVMLLSVIFTISCIPVVTIGAALTALDYATMKGLTLEDGYVWKYYFKSFKENLKQSTIIWLGLMVVYFVLGGNVWYWYNQNKLQPGMLSNTLLFISVILLFLVVMITMYVFPLQAKFVNGIKVQVRNAFLLSIKYFPTTMLLALILTTAAFLTYYQPYICIIGGILVGFGALGYLYNYFMLKCLKPYLEVEVEAEPDIEELVEAYRIPEKTDEAEEAAVEEAAADESAGISSEAVSTDDAEDTEEPSGGGIILEDVLEKEERDRLAAEKAEQERIAEEQSGQADENVPEAVKELKDRAEKAKVEIKPSDGSANVYRREASRGKNSNSHSSSHRKNTRKQRKK